MAETMETATTVTQHDCKEYASNSKATAGLTMGIIGTALGALNLIGGGMAVCNDNNKHNHHEHEHIQENINEAKALGILGMMNPWYGGYGYGGVRVNYGGWNDGWRGDGCINCEEKEIERKIGENRAKEIIDVYEGKLEGQKQLADSFFDTYKRDFELYKSNRDGFDILDNKLNESAFGLYKTTRDGFDIVNDKLNEAAFGLYKTDRDGFDDLNNKLNEAAFGLYKTDREGFDILNNKIVDSSFNLYKNTRDGFDIMNQKLTDATFGLYKEGRNNKDEVMGAVWATDAKINKKVDEVAFGLYKSERDDKDALTEKINKLQSKVDVMAAIRPYQDALINAKIDQNALMSDYNLSRRTCRMIEGELVLPNDPTVTGFKGVDGCNCGF